VSTNVLIIVFSGSSNLRSKIALTQFVDKLKNGSQHSIYGAFTDSDQELNLELVVQQIIQHDSPESIKIWPLFALPGQRIGSKDFDLPKLINKLKQNSPNISFNIEKPIDLEKDFFPIVKEIIQNRNLF